MSDTEERIRQRAYELWEQAGRPDDHSDHFWHTARQEIEGGAPGLDDAPGGTLDFPPESQSTEEPPVLSVATGVPGELPPAEAAAAEATVPRTPTGAAPELRQAPPKQGVPPGAATGKTQPEGTVLTATAASDADPANDAGRARVAGNAAPRKAAEAEPLAAAPGKPAAPRPASGPAPGPARR